MENEILELIDSLDDILENSQEHDSSSSTRYQNDDFHDEVKSDALICECFCVSREMILASLQQQDLHSGGKESISTENLIMLLKENYGLGQGCGFCLKKKEDWMSQFL